MTDYAELIAEARLAQCSECSEEGTSAAMRCDGDLIRRLADALEASQPSGDDREALIDVLVMTDLSNYAGTDMGLISQAADAILAAGFSRASAPDAATEIARSLAMASTITGADADVIAGASVKLAALGEIAELHALCDDRLWSVEKHAERMEAERDAALARIAELEMTVTSASFEFHEQFERAEKAEARIAEAAKLHQPQPFDDEPSESFCKTCQRTAGVWPCETAVALGLDEGENDD